MKHSQFALHSEQYQEDLPQLLLSPSVLAPSLPSPSHQILHTSLRFHSYNQDFFLFIPPERLNQYAQQAQYDALFFLQIRAIEKAALAYPNAPPLPPLCFPFPRATNKAMELPPAILCPHATHALHPHCVRCGGVLSPLIQPVTPHVVLFCTRCEKQHDPEEKPSILKSSWQRDLACERCPYEFQESQESCRKSAFFHFSTRPFFLTEKHGIDLETHYQQIRLSSEEIWDIAQKILDCTQNLHRIGLCNVVPAQLDQIILQPAPQKSAGLRFLPPAFFFDDLDILQIFRIFSPANPSKETRDLPIQRHDLPFHDLTINKDQLFCLHRQKQETNTLIQELRIGDLVGFIGKHQQLISGSIQKISTQQQQIVFSIQTLPLDPSNLPNRNQTLQASVFLHHGYSRDLEALCRLLRRILLSPSLPSTPPSASSDPSNNRDQQPSRNPAHLSPTFIEEIRSLLDTWPRPCSSEKARKQDAIDQIERLKTQLLRIQQRSDLERCRTKHQKKEAMLRDFQALGILSSRSKEFFVTKERLDSIEEDILIGQGHTATSLIRATQAKIQTDLRKKREMFEKQRDQAHAERLLSNAEKASYSLSMLPKEADRTLLDIVQSEAECESKLQQIDELILQRRAKRSEFEQLLQRCTEILQTKMLRCLEHPDAAEIQTSLSQEEQSFRQKLPQDLPFLQFIKLEEKTLHLKDIAEKEQMWLIEQVHQIQRQINLLPYKDYATGERSQIASRCQSLKQALEHAELLFSEARKMHQSLDIRLKQLHKDILQKQGALEEQAQFYEHTCKGLEHRSLPKKLSIPYNKLQEQIKSLRLFFIEESVIQIERSLSDIQTAFQHILALFKEDRQQRFQSFQQKIQKMEQQHEQTLIVFQTKQNLAQAFEDFQQAFNHFARHITSTPYEKKLMFHQMLLADQTFLSALEPQEAGLLEREINSLLEELQRLETTTKISSYPDLYEQLLDTQEKAKAIRKKSQSHYAIILWEEAADLQTKTKELQKQANSWLRSLKGLFSS